MEQVGVHLLIRILHLVEVVLVILMGIVVPDLQATLQVVVDQVLDPDLQVPQGVVGN